QVTSPVSGNWSTRSTACSGATACVRYSLDGAYDLLARLGFSCLRLRPRHERKNPAKQAEFRRNAPLLSARSSRH
ncbi:MAG: winged helix-turn-helix domain-containing protein, partial [Phycisphaerales bacterium]|nr:winged helix-turn-helix domain-containing protein [Phycisphaerales bacterium]